MLPAFESVLQQQQGEDPFVTGKRWERPTRGKPSAQSWTTRDDGLLRIGERLYVPPGLRSEVKELCHDSPSRGHLRIRRTLHRIRGRYYWDGMDPETREYVRTCPVCQMAKPRQHKPYRELAPLLVPATPF
ncbi:hypothetical protein IMZ48_43665 [Candidatus Bathyarchaeota archaeon]|nr:hypothetical protein [Candidatus Bathyarchaeota archaeon]